MTIIVFCLNKYFLLSRSSKYDRNSHPTSFMPTVHEDGQGHRALYLSKVKPRTLPYTASKTGFLTWRQCGGGGGGGGGFLCWAASESSGGPGPLRRLPVSDRVVTEFNIWFSFNTKLRRTVVSITKISQNLHSGNYNCALRQTQLSHLHYPELHRNFTTK